MINDEIKLKMSTTCLNCGATVYENFCPRCGQKADVKKLTWNSFIEEVFHFFTHIEKGFLKTTGQLIIHPGKLCKDYLDGKRKAYHKPISLNRGITQCMNNPMHFTQPCSKY